MFKKILKRAVRAVTTFVRRFLDNTPSNIYENIAFNMARTGAAQFGRERISFP